MMQVSTVYRQKSMDNLRKGIGLTWHIGFGRKVNLHLGSDICQCLNANYD